MNRNRYPFHNVARPTRAAMDAAARRCDARIAARQRSERTARALYCAAVAAVVVAFFYGL